MPIDPKTLRRQSAQLDREITRKVGAFEANLIDVWAAVRRRVVALTSELQAQGGRIQSTAVNLGVARRVAQELQGVIERAGLGRLIDGALDDMGELAKYQGIGQTTVRRVERESAWSGETLDVFRQVKYAELAAVPETALRQVERVLMKGIVSAQDRGELINELQALLDNTLPQARTVYDTALSEFSRLAVTSTARGTDDEAFLFDGPIDAVIRPFCAERVGKVFSRAEIDAMDNGQLDNTLLTGGGYNCRHTWVPIAPDDPLEDLADTGRFADPMYEDDLAQAREVAAKKGGR